MRPPAVPADTAPFSDQTPNRVPLACGALGHYDRDRVTKMAAILGDWVRIVHEDRSSILMLDREPLAWSGRRERGLGWIEGGAWQGGATSWTEASRLGACGLAFARHRRLAHSAVNGLAPLYWTDAGGATYFASRIEPLARSSPTPLSPDWEAWAAIIALRFPLGERTPFAEVRRLGPFATLERRFGRSQVRSPSWPWAEIEPHLDLAAGSEATAAALREALSPLRGNVLCPLSGGFDSRLLFSALAGSAGVVSLTALTLADDEGADFEERLAAPVAAALGTNHELLRGEDDEYWTDWEERARWVEHQFADHAWLMPLTRRVAGTAVPVPDGYALDTFLQTVPRFHTPEVLDTRDPGASNRALFESLRRYGLAHQALDESFHVSVVERARSQFLAAVKPFAGLPSQAILALYATRTVRGVSAYPSGVLGRAARVAVPGAQDPVVTASLSVSPPDKLGGRMRTEVQRLLAPDLVDLASTNDTPRSAPSLPRRWRSAPAIEGYRRALADGPLAEYVSPRLKAWLADPKRDELSGHLRLGMESVALLHAWCRLYEDVLRGVDADDLRGP